MKTVTRSADAADPISIMEPQSFIERPAFRNWFWLASAAGAVLVTVFILAVYGSDRHVQSLGIFLLKLVPFLLASLAIATFPRNAPTVLKVVIAFATIIPFWTYFVPRRLQFMRLGLQLGYETEPDGDFAPLTEAFEEYFILTQAIVPFVILMVVTAYRMGGGSFGNTMKVALAGILFMISGIEDIMFFAVNGLWPMPEQITWASHMTVRLGHVASRTEFFVACAVHFVAIGIVFALPFDRWVDRLRTPTGNADVDSPTTLDLTDSAV